MAWKKPKSKKPTANRCFECGTCLREFPAGWKSRNQHCEQVGHQSPEWECDRCHLYFGSETGKVHHMQAVNHFAHACQLCDVTLPTEARLTEHELKAHYHKCGFCDEQFHRDNGAELQKHELERHFYCCECDRMFQDSREVKVHLRSSIHLEEGSSCPHCNQVFMTAARLVKHLENGQCSEARQLDRELLHKLIKSKDAHCVLSKQVVAVSHRTTVYKATKKSKCGGTRYSCYRCHKKFKRLCELSLHLNSVVHQPALYHCSKPRCLKEMKTLTALIEHLESGACGHLSARHVQKNVGELVSGDQRLGGPKCPWTGMWEDAINSAPTDVAMIDSPSTETVETGRPYRRPNQKLDVVPSCRYYANLAY